MLCYASSSEPFCNFTKYAQISKEKLVTACNAASENNTNLIKSTPGKPAVVGTTNSIQTLRLYMRVFTQLQRPQIHVATMQTRQHSNICEESVYYDDFDPRKY